MECLLLLLTLLSSHLSAQSTPLRMEDFKTTTGPPSGDQITLSMLAPDRVTDNDVDLPVNVDDARGLLKYDDGSGTYIGSDEVQRSVGKKCWSDYFVVNQGYWYGPWKKASGNIYCTGTSECKLSRMDGYQTCQSWTVSLSAGIMDKIISFGIQSGYSEESCYSGQDTNECVWNDRACHCIWTQQVMMYQHGYKRRRCNNGKGDYTAWMSDWGHDAPTRRVNYGCGSKCTDTLYSSI